MEKSISIILVMSLNVIESTDRSPMELSGIPAASSEEKSVCGCRSKWADQPCIMSSIRKWDPNHILICSSCVYRKEEKTDHECMVYLIGSTPLSEEKRLQFLNDGVYRVLTNPKNVGELFNLYVNTHPNAEHLKANFQYGIRFLLGNKMAELREELIMKERFGGRE